MIKVTIDSKPLQKLISALGEGGCGPIVRGPFKAAAFAVYGNIAARVWQESGAKNEKGQPVGTYSEEYLKFRKKYHGKNNTAINFSLTGGMLRDWTIKQSDCNTYEIGFADGAIVDPYAKVPVRNPKKGRKPTKLIPSSEKYKQLKKTFGDFAGIGLAEKQVFAKVFYTELNKAINKTP